MEKFKSITRGTILALTAIMFSMIGAQLYWCYGTVEEIQVSILDKERICDKDGKNCDYMVFTDKETFKNIDSIWHLKFKSSDIYGVLKKDESYQLTVQGMRIPFLSQYRNILSYDIVRNKHR